MLGNKDSVIPTSWPSHLQTVYNEYNPMNIHLNNVSYSTYLSVSKSFQILTVHFINLY